MGDTYETWKQQRKKSIKEKVVKLTSKIIYLTGEVKRFGPRLRRRGMGTYYQERNGMIRNWHRGARLSLMATRKKIYSLQKEEKAL